MTDGPFDPEALRRIVAAVAQQEQAAPATAPRKGLSPLSLGMLVGGNGLDAASTIYALQNGARETNPILGDQPGAGKVLAVKGLGTLAQWLLLRKLAESKPELANWLAKGIGAGMAGVGAWNATQGSER